MLTASASYLTPLPVPPNYMRADEQKQVREMNGPMGRPVGDHRSADRIIEQSPVLKSFLDNRDNYLLIDDLKRNVGDWDSANPEVRANAIYDLDKVLRFIDNLDDRYLNGSHSRNGKNITSATASPIKGAFQPCLAMALRAASSPSR